MGRLTFVESHISQKTSEMWGTADSGYKCNISTRGDSCICQEVIVILICQSELLLRRS
jgi:hypothetical protein